MGVILLFAWDNPWQFIDAPSIAIVLSGTMAAIFLNYPLREVLRVFHLVGQVLMNMVLDGISTLACGRSQRSRGRGLADHRPVRDHVDLVADGAVHVASHGREGHGRNADPDPAL